ncbi:MAG: cytochrome c oxidase subunit II [Sediminibacterium sp.]
MKLLILLVIVLAIIAIAQLTKVYELSRSLRKNKEEEISAADNKLNANLMLVWMFLFFVGTVFLYVRYGDYLPVSASAHGVDVDQLMKVNIWMITIAFFIVNFFLFYFAWKYQFKKGRKAKFFAHDNRLEMLWTLVPGVVLAFIIVYGLITWNKITGPASADAIQIELYSRQFDWTARYPGENKTFGSASYNLISTSNPLGLVTKEGIRTKLDELDSQIENVEKQLEENKLMPLLPESYVATLVDKVSRLKRHKQRIADIDENNLNGLSTWEAGNDDRLVKGEMHIPVNKEVELIFRSQDVIHSAYLPHFRAQMNCVPGVATRLKMTPTITTAEMRKITGNDAFDYILLCNKVCGAAHFNMQMKVVVESEADYNAWVAKQKMFKAPEVKAEADTTLANEPKKDTVATAMGGK